MAYKLDRSQIVDFSNFTDLFFIGLKLKLSKSKRRFYVNDLLRVSFIKLLFSKLISLHDFFISAIKHYDTC